MTVDAHVDRSGRAAELDIRALARSGHVTACCALPITQRVQSSGRGEPALAGGGVRGLRALAILGRLYARGGHDRQQALALWLTFSGEKPRDGDEHHLALALGVLLSHREQLEVVRGWSRWAQGGNAKVLVKRGEKLLEGARAAYASCDESSGSSGHFGALLTEADVAQAAPRALRRWHQRESDVPRCSAVLPWRSARVCEVRARLADSDRSTRPCTRSARAPRGWCAGDAEFDAGECAWPLATRRARRARGRS